MSPEPKARRGPKKSAEVPAGSLYYDRATIAKLLLIHTRTLDRMISSEEFPPRDFSIKNSPRWKAETVARWVEGQSHNSN